MRNNYLSRPHVVYWMLPPLMFLVGFASANTIAKKIDNKEKTVQVERQEKELDSMINLDTSQGELSILVTQDQIMFEPLEKASSKFKQFSLSREEYPRLFEQGVAKASWLTARAYEENDKVFVIVSNKQPSHGGGETVFELLIDPLTEDVTTSPPKTL